MPDLTMQNFILHHYPLSPFSEKIRSMLNYAGMDYLSLVHSEIPPRKYLQMLAGNYARIPVAQIDSDIFCDTKTICAEIVRISEKPELDFFQADDQVKDFVRHVEGEIFFACVLSASTPSFRKKARQQMGWFGIAKILFDRINMGRKATTNNMIKPSQAKSILRQHLIDMESRLTTDFIFGEKPNIADFSAYHSLWFVRDLGECLFMKDYPRVCQWMDRIKSLGSSSQVSVTEIEGVNAWKIAEKTQPRLLATEIIGNEKPLQNTHKVSIGPSDYRQVKTSGVLYFEDDYRWVIERQNDKVGKVHVHFPKESYCISKN